MYGLIHAERASIAVARACRVLEVSRRGYYQWRRTLDHCDPCGPGIPNRSHWALFLVDCGGYGPDFASKHRPFGSAKVELLNSRKVEYLVVGGHAVAFHGHPRFTGDIGFFINASPGNAGRVLDVLTSFGFGDLGIDVDDLTAPDRVVQLGRPPNRIDILTTIRIAARKKKGGYASPAVSHGRVWRTASGRLGARSKRPRPVGALACALQYRLSMSHTAFIVRSLALGAALGLGFAVVWRRRAAPVLAVPSGAKRPGARVASPPSPVLLPLAFWDAEADLDAEERPKSAGPELTFDDSYDAAALEDASEWLARATEAREKDEADDPAEIAPDSWSMVSEASRAAAAGEPALDSEAPSQRT